MKMDTPCVLITSCADFSADSLVKEVLECDSLPESTPIIEKIVGYEWKIETKYYTADTLLCVSPYRTIGDQDFANRLQAFVVYFDAEETSSFDCVKLWTSYLDQIDPEIKILVCHKCTDNSAINRLTSQTWCIENGFELVELKPDDNSDSDTEDDFRETTGVKRIIQALHAHTWPNLVLKDSRHSVSPYIRQLVQEQRDLQKSEKENQTNTTAESNQTDSTDNKLGFEDNFTDFHDHKHSDDHFGEFQSCQVENKDDKLDKSEIEGKSEKKTETDKEEVDKKKESDTKDDSDVLDNNRESGVENKEPSDHSKVDDSDRTKTESNDNNETKETTSKEESEQCNGAEGKTANKKTSKAKKQTKEERLDSLLPEDDMSLFAALGTEDPGGEGFEKLFERLAHMKEKANSLPFPERKKYAENVAIAFWNAIGGDDDEIGDLDSDG